MNNSLYSIDSTLYNIYSDLLDKEFAEKEQTEEVLKQILDTYDPPTPSVLPKKSSIFKVKAFSDYIAKSPMYISFKAGQKFFVLNTIKEKKEYIVSTDRKAPFKFGALSGKVPSYYFNKIE
jgi:hypothetical protein